MSHSRKDKGKSQVGFLESWGSGTKRTRWIFEGELYLSLPPTRQDWHKVNNLKVNYSGDLGEGKVGHDPRLESCWTMLVISQLSAMWAWWAKLDMDPNLDAWLSLKLDSKVQYYTRVTRVSVIQVAQPKPFSFKFAFVGQWLLASKPTAN